MKSINARQNSVRFQGIADPEKVAIYGGSYGGYATLAGLCFTPDVYCCGVDIVGPSHAKTLFQSIPPCAPRPSVCCQGNTVVDGSDIIMSAT